MINFMIAKENCKRSIAYLTLFCSIFSFQQPSKLYAENEPCCGNCILVNQEEAQRAKTAKFVAGLTLIAVIGGVAYFAFGSSCHGHSHSSSCSSSSYRGHSYSSSCDSSSDDSSSSRRHSHSHSHRHSHSSDYSSSFWESSTGSNSILRNDEGFDMPLEGNFQLPRIKKSQESNQITGVFVTHPTLSPSCKGSMTAYVQLPDGTSQVLGTLPFSANGGSSLSYGPFTQKGSYVFGMKLNDGILSSSTKVGSVEIHVNGSTVEVRDYVVPAYAPTHYEASPCEFMHK